MYEKTVGKLAINKDGIVVGTLNGKETEYIQKSVAEVLRNMAVNRAKAEAVKELMDLTIKTICEKVSAPTPSESYIVEKCNETIYNLAKEFINGKGKVEGADM